MNVLEAMTKTEWYEYVEFVENLAIALPKEIRNEYVENLLDLHYAHFGKSPTPKELERLADIILVEHLKDKDPDKMTNTEYPYMSSRQELKRKVREMSMETDTIDYMNVKYQKRLDSTFKKRTTDKED